MEQQGLEITPTASAQEMTPSRAVGLMLRRNADLTPEAKITLKQMCQLHPHIEYGVCGAAEQESGRRPIPA